MVSLSMTDFSTTVGSQFSCTRTHTGIVNTDGALWKEQRAFLHSVLRKLGAKSMILGRDCLELKIRVSD